MYYWYECGDIDAAAGSMDVLTVTVTVTVTVI
jgi:hypothetical protein